MHRMNFFSKLFSSSAPEPDSGESPLFIVGLGNPGQRYAGTRHNLGWLLLDELHSAWDGGPWRAEKRFRASVSDARSGARKIILVKPETYMNESGAAVKALLDFYKAAPGDLIVLHDEADIPFGRTKTTQSSRAAGHNGVRDIIERLGTQNFRRLRLGVGKSANPNISTADHVLQPFTDLERVALPAFLSEARGRLETELLR